MGGLFGCAAAANNSLMSTFVADNSFLGQNSKYGLQIEAQSQSSAQGQASPVGQINESGGLGGPHYALYSVSSDGAVIATSNRPTGGQHRGGQQLWSQQTSQQPGVQQLGSQQPVGQQTAPGRIIPFYGNFAAGFAMMTDAISPAGPGPESKSNDAFLLHARQYQ